MKPVAPEVRKLIQDWAAEQDGGLVYAPVLHPEFKHLPFVNGADRIDKIVRYLKPAGGDVLDLGSHWGYIAHRLEDLGYRVTAVEQSDKHFAVMKGLRDASEKKFTTVHSSVFDLPDLDYDIVIALNLFHHFLKTKGRFRKFVPFLKRIKCRTMIFQAHRPQEPQMKDAYLNFGPEMFVGFVAAHTGLCKVKLIGDYNKRMIYQLQKPG